MLSELLNFIYPPDCSVCGFRMQSDGSRRICADCTTSIERITEPFCIKCGVPLATGGADANGTCFRCRQSPPAFRMARSALRYQPSAEERAGTVGSMIRRLKYGFEQSLGPALIECVGERLPFAPGEHDVVIPVPLHRKRLRWRGYNQASLLGAAVARLLGCTFDSTALARIRTTAPQTSYNYQLRRRNMRGAFIATRRANINGLKILLVDDVMTTGATAGECAKVLNEAGAIAVDVFTLARVL